MKLKEQFETELREKLKNSLGEKSVLAVPIIEKIVVNMGIGSKRDNKVFVKEAIDDIAKITGQKPSERKARVSISNFKLRKGQLVGLKVTLRGKRMWDFYEKLVKIALPRVKDFRGVTKKSFDRAGNYNLGLEEHTVFQEIDPNKVAFIKPFQISISTTARNDDDSYQLLKALGMPYRD